jgi:hypothetical protein
MYYGIDAFGPVAIPYYICMVLLCSFFLLNILAAVILSRFEELNEEKREAAEVRALVPHPVTCRVSRGCRSLRRGGAGRGVSAADAAS